MKIFIAIYIILFTFKLIDAPIIPTEHESFETFIKNMKKKELKLLNGIKFTYWSQSLKNKDPPSIDIDFYNVEPLLKYWTEDKPVKVLTHGWRSARGALMIKDAYVETTEFNVITMDWSKTSYKINYIKVASLSPDVGKYLGHFLANLVKYDIVKPCYIHVIAHSLGAQIAGISGRTFETLMKQKIKHITGLDPSRPTFDGPRYLTWNSNHVLNTDDAEFVDVIHTAGGLFGIKIPIGHADFYPNNGVSPQPQCRKFFFPIQREHCSHSSGYLFYSVSVKNHNSFESLKCSSMEAFDKGECNNNDRNYMGNDVNFSCHGTFYLKTKPTPPYSENLKLPKS